MPSKPSSALSQKCGYDTKHHYPLGYKVLGQSGLYFLHTYRPRSIF
jgi:hypothetical protein